MSIKKAIRAGTAAGRDTGAAENTTHCHGSPAPIALASPAIAQAASVPAAVHLDHAESVGLAHTAVELGSASVMFNAAGLPYAKRCRRHPEDHGALPQPEVMSRGRRRRGQERCPRPGSPRRSG
ncbi:class II fructose-bisphosphate aldolase [Streptomyces sp. NPDC091267]|uniref:class II fructose-bisphosphate aldolase n=1 Tax=unclassified Streptomyces TaxID=2593676 RepID=UPI0034484367